MPKLYIANGVDVDPQWTDRIAVSDNQRDWSQIFTRNISKLTDSRNANHPEDDSLAVTARIRIHLNDGTVGLTFDVQNVASGTGTGEQTGWQDGSQTQLNAAVSEINSWI